ncbi:Stk1 family PASTA domain-containing Ser/Thr kinase [Microlunatus soli]|uniref:non-specific serine/threonine protein kinase n=1 Tax=Microlunatus soli TaxID=630515 RepID=A0A1H1TN24_9ACTN|nr:Stk1 family PASTA domain-containing Ser/Thr kinase [Microlunatus soli]SDS61544.1 serine/threonine protein kinase [Microlunatus soli]
MTEPETPGTKVVGGRYELGEPLGRGGMAEVRRAVDRRLGRQVAVKQLRPDLATDPTFQARFRREAQSAAGLNHPNIVAVYDTGEETDPHTGVQVPYIVMELVEGPTLRDILREGRKILPERALELTNGVLDALTYSHRAGIVHRDIKPANVMLTHSGDVKVMDFGIARAVADTSATMTQTAAVIGTAQYLSPEQARGETVDARSDLYSAGCLMYELLVGRPPFTGESPVSVAYQHVREAPKPPSEVDPTITPDIDAIALKSLAKEPDDRYQSAREMKTAINRVLAGDQTTIAAPIPAATRQPADAGPDPDATRVVPAAAAVGAGGNTPSRALPGSGVDDLDEEDEEPRKRRTGLVIGLIIAIVVVLAAIGIGAKYWYDSNQPQTAPPPTKVAVPSVTGMDRNRAEAELKDKGLTANVVNVNGPDDNTINTATKQEPSAGTKVDPGSSVEVDINQGPKTATVPKDLVGKPYKKVLASLKDAGFDTDNIKKETAPQPEALDLKKNEVTAVDPGEGDEVAVSSDITVTVATGKSEVPDLVGSLADPAEQRAEQSGFDTTITEKEDPDNPAGTVIDQSPSEGTLLERDSTIELTVAKEPPPPPKKSPTATKSPSKEPSKKPTASASESASDKPTASKKPTSSASASKSAKKDDEGDDDEG